MSRDEIQDLIGADRLFVLEAHGLVVVPKVAAPAMCAAYYDLCKAEDSLAVRASDIYRVMIEAAGEK